MDAEPATNVIPESPGMRNIGGVMTALYGSRSLEAEIAECCRDMYWATDAREALRNWARLRTLRARQAEAERMQFLLEARARESVAGRPD
jgi:hypothetical protein